MDYFRNCINPEFQAICWGAMARTFVRSIPLILKESTCREGFPKAFEDTLSQRLEKANVSEKALMRNIEYQYFNRKEHF